MNKIRPIAIAIIKNTDGEIFVHHGFDSVKNETFYPPLGIGIAFGEKVLIREFKEENFFQRYKGNIKFFPDIERKHRKKPH